jgi:type II secretory pathway pseudopilin PulG
VVLSPRRRRDFFTVWSRCRQRRDETGFALITVILVMVVIALLSAVLVQNIVSDLNGARRQVQVTSGLTAADAGLSDLVYQLQQGTNWSTYQTTYSSCGTGSCTYPTTTTGTWYGWNTVGTGRYEAHIDSCAILSSTRLSSSSCQTGTDVVATVAGQFPAVAGATQTIQAVVRNQAGGPVAFKYAMFGDTGIQVHHHNDSYISPTIVTSSIHSNGFITLNYPAIYRVGSMEASGAITIADGGGSTPAGSVTTSYNWPYWISGSDATNPARCYPALQYPALQMPTGGVTNSYWAVPTGSGASSSCAGEPQWSPNSVVVGNILANSVEIKAHGDTQVPTGLPVVNGNQWTPEATGTTCGPTNQAGFTDPVTGSCIPDDPANLDAGSVRFDVTGQTYTGPNSTTNAVAVESSSNGCTGCNQGTSDLSGHIGGQVNLHNSSWAPPSVPFPSINFTTVTYPVAKTDQGGATSCTTGSTCHIFSSASAFLSWMELPGNVYNPGTGTSYSASTNPCPTTYCMTWLDSTKKYTATASAVAYVVLRGTYEITGTTNLALAENTLRSAFGVGSAAATPTIMVAGALINEGGDITLTASLTVVGPTMDPFSPLTPDSQLPAGNFTVPGLLASGGGGQAISSTDYDTDNPYTSTANYQSIYKNTVIVRGLVYTGAYSSSTGTSTSENQHWHNSDPKNTQIIVGAQIGGLLHDCSNFTFSYDPLIENLQGFSGGGGGGVYVVDWVQL